MTDEFPIVRIHLSTYIHLVKRYVALVWDAHESWGSSLHPNVGFVYCQYTGRILAYPMKTVPMGYVTPGSWYHLGAIGYPFFDRSLLEYEDRAESIGGIRRGYIGWYQKGKGVRASNYHEGTPVRDARRHVLYEIVVISDVVPEDLSAGD